MVGCIVDALLSDTTWGAVLLMPYPWYQGGLLLMLYPGYHVGGCVVDALPPGTMWGGCVIDVLPAPVLGEGLQPLLCLPRSEIVRV